VIGGAVAIGPIVGGLITSGIGWEWILLRQRPIGIGAVALTLMQVSESRDPNAHGVDWLGLLTFSGSLFLLVFALIEGNEKGWGSTRIVAFLVASAVLIVLFVIVEHRQQRPMLDLTLFRRPRSPARASSRSRSQRRCSRCSCISRCTSRTCSATARCRAGLRFLPITLLSFFVAPISGRLSVRVPVRLLLGCGPGPRRAGRWR